MAPGTAWYIGVGNPHSVVNRGSSDRVHLVIDATLNAWLVDLLETAERASDARQIARNGLSSPNPAE
jgi:hypothetical protein